MSLFDTLDKIMSFMELQIYKRFKATINDTPEIGYSETISSDDVLIENILNYYKKTLNEICQAAIKEYNLKALQLCAFFPNCTNYIADVFGIRYNACKPNATINQVIVRSDIPFIYIKLVDNVGNTCILLANNKFTSYEVLHKRSLLIRLLQYTFAERLFNNSQFKSNFYTIYRNHFNMITKLIDINYPDALKRSVLHSLSVDGPYLQYWFSLASYPIVIKMSIPAYRELTDILDYVDIYKINKPALIKKYLWDGVCFKIVKIKEVAYEQITLTLDDIERGVDFPTNNDVVNDVVNLIHSNYLKLLQPFANELFNLYKSYLSDIKPIIDSTNKLSLPDWWFDDMFSTYRYWKNSTTHIEMYPLVKL